MQIVLLKIQYYAFYIFSFCNNAKKNYQQTFATFLDQDNLCVSSNIYAVFFFKHYFYIMQLQNLKQYMHWNFYIFKSNIIDIWNSKRQNPLQTNSQPNRIKYKKLKESKLFYTYYGFFFIIAKSWFFKTRLFCSISDRFKYNQDLISKFWFEIKAELNKRTDIYVVGCAKSRNKPHHQALAVPAQDPLALRRFRPPLPNHPRFPNLTLKKLGLLIEDKWFFSKFFVF